MKFVNENVLTVILQSLLQNALVETLQYSLNAFYSFGAALI